MRFAFNKKQKQSKSKIILFFIISFLYLFTASKSFAFNCAEGTYPVVLGQNNDGSINYVCEKKFTVYRDSYGIEPSAIANMWGDSSAISDALRMESGSLDGSGTNNLQCSNPIMVASAKKVQYEVDYQSREEFPLVISRTYNQASQERGAFGNKWSSDFDRHLFFLYPPQEPQPCPEENMWRGRCLLPPPPPPKPISVIVLQPGGLKFKFDYDVVTESWMDSTDGSLRTLKEESDHWVFTSESNFVEHYNSSGRITQRTNPTGISHFFEYDANGILEKVTHASGRKLTFEFSSNYSIQRIIDNAGNAYEYGYSGNLLALVIKPGTPAIKVNYYYEDNINPGALTSISVNNQNFATFKYNSNGHAISSEHAGGVEKSIFNYSSHRTTIVDPNGQETWFNYEIIDGYKKITSVSRQATSTCPYGNRAQYYDENGNLRRERDWNWNINDYQYNEDGLLLRKVIASGSDDEEIYNYEWIMGDNRVKKKVTSSSETIYDYYENGRIKSETVIDLARLGSENDRKITQYAYEYYSNGMVRKKML